MDNLFSEKTSCLVIGRGSMGKRRIRDLSILGYDVKSWDITDKEKMPDLKNFSFVVISTPPNMHNFYIERAIEANTPVFIEASVVLGNLEELNEKAKRENILVCPSCTFSFDKYVRKIKQMFNEGVLGKPLGFTYHLGQCLLDWHPGQPLDNFYAAKKQTGAAKEMVTFDWTWLFDLFGFPENVKGFYGKTLEMGCDIDDTYAMALKYPDKLGVMMTDVVAKEYIKRLVINTDMLTFIQDWGNVGIDEGMYLDEIKAFISAVEGKEPFPNTLDKDIRILKLLKDFEYRNK